MVLLSSVEKKMELTVNMMTQSFTVVIELQSVAASIFIYLQDLGIVFIVWVWCWNDSDFDTIEVDFNSSAQREVCHDQDLFSVDPHVVSVDK